ncbi:hypothetical protein GUITHDRAFT_72753 [Guillardia theta CCMP2712]|uniref:Pre-mRNA-splicing factor RBM22 n=1 Tax=Guillardia theta (strain CCMP2712) TaxID=905079 RepID=L1J6T4_GUITC|nr:hypothetical protein GUITHDRAFT_72753 [Guillardia theta CCMP2712]EKX43794.1 hypothetical protein GUITHDRAFT_72753 [Guillardia theta CCMP2712]|eukprot:XP_005830774.1 hypothetical protein GUITHDRAFT_72753 [Guillardia theta CCMP2712]
MKNPARVQRARPADDNRDKAVHNLWKGCSTRKDEKQAKIAETRCHPAKDSGYTRAGKGDPICVFFAQGRCDKGPNCDYWHRIPNKEDEDMLGAAMDVFGRDRFASSREDMGGVGSFSRENRTLYVGRVNTNREDAEKIVHAQFSEFGQIESVRVLAGRNCAFVKYRLRAAAEFAKEAMAFQSIFPGDPACNLRWATEDPNPGARRAEMDRVQRQAAEHLMVQSASSNFKYLECWQDKGVCLSDAPYNYPSNYNLPIKRPYGALSSVGASKNTCIDEYPDTNQQFAQGNSSVGGEGEWITYITPDGIPYYHNSVTQQTSWQVIMVGYLICQN